MGPLGKQCSVCTGCDFVRAAIGDVRKYYSTEEGKTYVLDGHNRLEALSDMNYSKEINIVNLSLDKAKEIYKSKVDDIKSGAFNTKIGQ